MECHNYVKRQLTSAALIVSLSIAGCQTTSLDTSKNSYIQTACETSRNLISEDFGIGDLPGILVLDGTSSTELLAEFSRDLDADEAIRLQHDDWLSKQERGRIARHWRFGVGISSEITAAGDVREITSKRLAHAQYSRIMAMGDVLNQISAFQSGQTSSDSQSTLTRHQREARALFGIIPIKTVESYENGKYSFATLVAWNPDIETVFTGVALGCFEQKQTSQIASIATISRTLENALVQIPGKGIPFGGRKIVLSDGRFGYFGFGSIPFDGTAVEAKKAARAAESIARSNALREIFSEQVIESVTRGKLQLSQQSFDIAEPITENAESSLRGIRLPGLRKLAETIIHDPISGKKVYIVVSGLIPHESKRIREAIRKIIIDRFRNESRALGLV